MLLLQLSYISQRVESSQKYNSDPEGCPVDWQDLMMVVAVSDERGRPLRGYYQFHVKQNNYVYPQNMLY